MGNKKAEAEELSDTLDKMQGARRGTNQDATPLTPEEKITAAKDREVAGLEGMLDSNARKDRKLWAERRAIVKRLLRGAVDSLKHGESYDADDRAVIVAEAVRNLGDVPPVAKARIAELVNKAADAIVDGDLMTGQIDAEDAADFVANNLRSHWSPPESPAENDPIALADTIRRSSGELPPQVAR